MITPSKPPVAMGYAANDLGMIGGNNHMSDVLRRWREIQNGLEGDPRKKRPDIFGWPMGAASELGL